MAILFGLGLGASLLYFWLIGNWFARVLVFLGLAVVLAFAGTSLFSAIPNGTEATPFTGGVLGIAIAWALASIPRWIMGESAD